MQGLTLPLRVPLDQGTFNSIQGRFDLPVDVRARIGEFEADSTSIALVDIAPYQDWLPRFGA